MCRCACCFTMHRVPVLVTTALQHNTVLRRGHLVAVKDIKRGERVTVRPQTYPDGNMPTVRTKGIYGTRLGSDDPGFEPFFDKERYSY